MKTKNLEDKLKKIRSKTMSFYYHKRPKKIKLPPEMKIIKKESEKIKGNAFSTN